MNPNPRSATSFLMVPDTLLDLLSRTEYLALSRPVRAGPTASAPRGALGILPYVIAGETTVEAAAHSSTSELERGRRVRAKRITPDGTSHSIVFTLSRPIWTVGSCSNSLLASATGTLRILSPRNSGSSSGPAAESAGPPSTGPISHPLFKPLTITSPFVPQK